MDMARPEIPDVEKERIEAIYERHRGYTPKSFQEALSTVADLAERAVDDREIESELPFKYNVEDIGSRIVIHLSPESESGIERTKSGLSTQKAVIDTDKIYEALQEIEGVVNAHGTRDSIVNVVVEKDAERSFDKVVDDVFSVLASIIQREEDMVEQVKQRADQYASQRDSTDT